MGVDRHASERDREGAADRDDDLGLVAALARLPGRLSGAMRLFHELTGFSAVASVRGGREQGSSDGSIAPPVHPRCASALRSTAKPVSCDEEWQEHLRVGLLSRDVQTHRCSLGLRCACAPVFYGESLVGIVKFVADAETEDRRFSAAVRALELAVSHACQESYVAALIEERAALRRQVAELRRVAGRAGSAAGGGPSPLGARLACGSTAHDLSRVDEVLEYVHGRYRDPALSLAVVGRAMGLGDTVLTHLFTRVVGQRMQAYVVSLRVQQACRELLATRKSITAIAHECGFRQPRGFRRAFHRQMGVSPSTYRRVFAGP